MQNIKYLLHHVGQNTGKELNVALKIVFLGTQWIIETPVPPLTSGESIYDTAWHIRDHNEFNENYYNLLFQKRFILVKKKINTQEID